MSTVVVGAGLSGLVAARECARRDDDVVVLEARDRIGGRLWTVRNRLSGGQFAELGAETLYAGHTHVLDLARSLDLDVVSCGYFDPSAPPMLHGGRSLAEAERRSITGWLTRAYDETPPATGENLAAWTSRIHAPAAVLRFLRSYVQYTPVASMRDSDAAEFARQLDPHGSGSFRVVGGNDLMAHRLAEGLDVRLRQPVRVVDWSGPRVRVETDDDILEADRVVVAVPGPLTSSIGFWPALPLAKVAALDELTYGTAAKVVVQYAERQLVTRAVGAGCFTDGVPPWIVEQSIHQPGDHACVSSLLAGDAEPRMLGDETFAAFDDTVASLVEQRLTRSGALAHSWTDDPWARAVVRAPIGDQRTRILPTVQQPLADRVFFAGEHTDDRVGPGGLEGATRSGQRVADEINRAAR